jgi:2-phospho-L-lactate guanylyltransferase
MTTFALIPVKELDKAKARLAVVLDHAARRDLALAMFRDVLAAAQGCAALDGVCVVSTDREVLDVAAQACAEGMAEPGDLNEALASAAEKLRARGVERIAVLAADLPLADAGSIAALLDVGTDVAVARAHDRGTGALALPPGAIAFRFGPDSARRHAEAASEAGLRCTTVDLPALALDIDTPADLDRLRAEGGAIGAHTRAALERMGLASPASASGGP